MRYLLDTCVISELISAKRHPGVVAWVDDRDEETLFLSVLTIGEIQKGISKLEDHKKRERLQTWVERDLSQRFRGRILDVNQEVASRWGRLLGEAERRGQTLPIMDSLIATTALTHNLVVVTRNVRDMERCNVEVFDPWNE